jgi:large subunit ribosomal protein L5
MEQFSYSSIMEVPRLLKICINQGIGGATQDKKLVDISINEMSSMAGQKAVPCVAKNSVSNFKLREGMTIGAKVTLRDFRGINDKSFDGRGNYTLGVKEQIIFPEINIDRINKITGMDITFVTTAKTDSEAYALLKELGMPFKNIRN